MLLVGPHTRPCAAEPPAASKPEVTILTPHAGALFSGGEVTVRLVVTLPKGSSLLGLRALVDGRPAAQARGIVLSAEGAPAVAVKDGQLIRSITVPVPARGCTLSIFAETSAGTSAAVSLPLRYEARSAADHSASAQPRLYVLAIGISAYQQPALQLQFAAKDARDLAAAFRLQDKVFYRSTEVKVLTDQQATKNNILDGLEWLQRQTTQKDIAVLFMAGHGITEAGTGVYHFLPHDADVDAVKRSMLPETDIRNTLRSIPGKVLLFLDSCHSGKVFNGEQTRGPADFSAFISELATAENGVIVFAASSGRQASREASTWNNGAFTKALVEGLHGRADTRKTGRVTHTMLDLYISERVKELTGGRQTPTTAKPATIPDFPIALVREIRDDDVDLVR